MTGVFGGWYACTSCRGAWNCI